MDDWTRARDSWLRELPEDSREGNLASRRQHDALARADAAYDTAQRHAREVPRAVIALRQEWARLKAGRLLEEQAYDVLRCDDGAEALGTVAAVQPELLLCEEPLPSVATLDVVRWVARLSPKTRVVVQVQHSGDAARALQAGAAVALPRTTPLDELVRSALG